MITVADNISSPSCPGMRRPPSDPGVPKGAGLGVEGASGADSDSRPPFTPPDSYGAATATAERDARPPAVSDSVLPFGSGEAADISSLLLVAFLICLQISKEKRLKWLKRMILK